MIDPEEIFFDRRAQVVFGAPGRAAIVTHDDGRITVVVESAEGQVAHAVFGPGEKPRLVAAIEASPGS